MSANAAIVSLAHAVARSLRASGLKLVTAESCTGGGLAKAITDVAGSSAWFERGFVTYSNESKMEMLGVGAEILAAHGAVSEHTAREMTTGALRHSRADIAVAVTGVAGPDGGTAEKPIGTVWIAWQRRDAQISTACHLFAGDRKRVRDQSVIAALEGIVSLVQP